MKQILLEYGPFHLPSYGFFVGLAFIIVMYLSEKRGIEIGIPRNIMLDFLFAIAIGAILGSSLLNFLFSGDDFHKALSQEGRAFLAGMSGSLIAGLFYLKIRGIPILPVADVVFLNVPIGHAIGRLGCWFYGCCHGKICPYDFPFIFQFPKIEDYSGKIVGSPAFQKHLDMDLISNGASYSLPVYPTQLFAVIYLILLFFILRTLYKKPSVKSRPGSIIFSYFLLNGILRFIEEIYRVNVRYFGLLTNAQIVSIIMIIIGCIGFIIVYKKQPLSKIDLSYLNKEKKKRKKVYEK